MKNVIIGTKYEFKLENSADSPKLVLPLTAKLPGGKLVFKHERLNVSFTVDCSQVVRRAS